VPAREATRIRTDGRPTPAFREELRCIPNVRNALSVVSTSVQMLAILWAAAWTTQWAWWPAAWFVAVLLLGRTNAQLASLMHESAHRLLFSNKLLNDVVGRWILGFPVRTSTDAYRRVRLTFLKIVLVQIVLAVLMTVFGHPLMYPLLWLLPYLTVWRVINRLRSIAEHGGLRPSTDRSNTPPTGHSGPVCAPGTDPPHTPRRFPYADSGNPGPEID
jgi:fatty acid desaturase